MRKKACGYQVLPGTADLDGFYFACLDKELRSPEKTMSLHTVREHMKRRGRALLVLAIAFVFSFGTGLAQEAVEREGYFEVRSASTTLDGDVHRLDARLQLVLSSEALAALESGVTLTIEMQMQVIRVRRLWTDNVEAELAVRHELEYSPLSQRYVVRNLNSGEQDTFATLYSALNSLGPRAGVCRSSTMPCSRRTGPTGLRLRADAQYRAVSRPVCG